MADFMGISRSAVGLDKLEFGKKRIYHLRFGITEDGEGMEFRQGRCAQTKVENIHYKVAFASQGKERHYDLG